MDYIKSMRLKQWIKNILIFVSMFTSGSFNYDNFFTLLYIFASFSLVVSSTYIFNDFIDIDSDSKHPTKSSRPIAAGKISKKNGITFMFFLFLLGNLTLYFLDSRLIVFSLLYTVITYSYSKKLKYIKYLDISVIALLFVLRILIGSLATSVPTSSPLILFIFFISLGIAAGKKLSIMKNELITASNVKDFLIISYSEDNLIFTLKSTLQLSLVTYIIWVIVVKSLILNSLSSVFLAISCIFLFFFIDKFIENSILGLTEEIIEQVKDDKSLTYLALLFGVSLSLGLIF